MSLKQFKTINFMKSFHKLSIFFTSFLAMFQASGVLAQTGCTLNGKEVPCSEVGGFAALGFGFMAVFFIIGILFFIFWIMMIVHAASNNIENKALWIVLIVIFQALGAIVYYFAVKRPFDKAKKSAPMAPAAPSTPPTMTPPPASMNQ